MGEYRGYRIAAMSPPSSGGLTMIQALKMIERYPLGDVAAGFGFGKVNTLHVMAEAMRIAWSDRAVWMGDEDFVDVPKRGLLASRLRARARRHDQPDRAHPGHRALRRPVAVRIAEAARGPSPTSPPPSRSATPAATPRTSRWSTSGATWSRTPPPSKRAGAPGSWFPGYGFMLNNELTDFNFGLNPHPRFGGPGANDVQGGKRPRSSMTPTILFKGDEPIAAFGSPGGATIINSVYNVLINLVDHGMTIKEAVEAPRISVTTRRQLDRARGGLRRGRDRQAARAGAHRRQPRQHRQRQRGVHRPQDRPPVRRGRHDARGRADRPAEEDAPRRR